MTGLELPDGNKLAFAYDDYSRLVEEIDPLGRSTCYSYHLNTNDGLPHSCTDPLGNTTHLWWNELGQIEQYQDCSGHRTHYAYDERLHLLSIKDALERTTRLTRKANDEVTRIEHPDGSHDGYSYNALGQLLSHTDADDRTTYVIRTQRGLLSKRQDARGQHVHYEYDKCQRLIGLLNENKAAYRFSYDASGQLRSRQPDHPQLQTEDFSYDPAGNLSDSGRWQFESLPDNRLVAFKDLRFSYDTRGNLSEKSSAAGGMQRFHYDSENRLISAQTWQGATLSSEARYHYDALGRRIGKQVTQDGQTQETKFLWQGLRLLQEQQPQLHSLYLYEPGSYAPLARIDSDPELPEQEARHDYFHTDQIGTPQEMTNVEGHVVWRAYYKAWGGLEALSPNLVE